MWMGKIADMGGASNFPDDVNCAIQTTTATTPACALRRRLGAHVSGFKNVREGREGREEEEGKEEDRERAADA